MTTRSVEYSQGIQFTNIFKQHEYRLFTLALSLTKSDQYARTIVQDVFLKLWESRHHMHSIRNMDAWLYRLAENRILDFLRKTADDKRLREALWVNMQHFFVEPEETTYSIEYNRIIENAIDHLPPQRKRIYRQNSIHGLNYHQIAIDLNVSRNSFKDRLISALDSFRTFFSNTPR